MIIGLTGPNASGKGEAADYLKSKGFTYYSLSDILREKAKTMGIEASRENLINLGNDLRRKNGPSYLATEIIKKIAGETDYIIDSIRNPDEIKALRCIDGFKLIGIDAPVELRFKRLISRKRLGDSASFEDFIKKEEKENINSSENQQIKNCLLLADQIIVNNSTLTEFYKKIDEAIS